MSRTRWLTKVKMTVGWLMDLFQMLAEYLFISIHSLADIIYNTWIKSQQKDVIRLALFYVAQV